MNYNNANIEISINLMLDFDRIIQKHDIDILSENTEFFYQTG